ncbi:MAG: hypothetical protein Ct9H300mP31_05370 [Acidimicrobiaceae bacterium]|nr:MAG: hypothetical protein Ct9H300mP31_05370 [Acidimicrobiaceae bacterium]
MRGDEVLATQEVVAAVTGISGRPVRLPETMVERLTSYLVVAPTSSPEREG